jgi:hypothetical protein
VPKKSKTSEQTPAPTDLTTPGLNDGRSGSAEKKPIARRIAAGIRKPASQKRKSKAEISDEAIRVRAYFISQERIRFAIPGDPKSDWIEARRQLLAELGES